MSIQKTYIGDGVYAEYDGVGVVLTTENGISVTNRIVLEHEVLSELGKFILQLQKELHDAAQPKPESTGEPLPPTDIPFEDGPLEEVTLESEIDRVKGWLDAIGPFAADSEPESVGMARADVAFAEKSIADENPLDQVAAMNKLARWQT